MGWLSYFSEELVLILFGRFSVYAEERGIERLSVGKAASLGNVRHCQIPVTLVSHHGNRFSDAITCYQ